MKGEFGCPEVETAMILNALAAKLKNPPTEAGGINRNG